jgi:hypothetical protein
MSDHDRGDDPGERCTGRTAAGKRCSRDAEEGSTRCAQHGYKPMGRPSKLTAELREQIIYLILEGNYIETACQAVGVSPVTYHRWIARANNAEAKATELLTDAELERNPDAVYDKSDPADWLYLDFRHAIKTAEAFAETEQVRKWVRAAEYGAAWQAFAALLERRHPSRWRRRMGVDADVSSSGTIRTELVVPATEEKRVEVASILGQALGIKPAAPAKTTARKASTRTPRKRGSK